MYAGIDFGTSNCSIGVWKENQPSLLKIDGENTLLASALYTSKSEIVIDKIDEDELRKRVKDAKTSQEKKRKQEEAATGDGYLSKLLTDEELFSHERGVMRRELAARAFKAQEGESLREALYSANETSFGEAAIRNHLSDPQSGYFVKSPKSFLGADLGTRHIELFSEIITRMLAHIKHCAEIQVEDEIDRVVVGRPVNFHGLRGEDGNRQAIGILETAAIAAGFKYVEFLYEPIAAALDYERTINTDLTVLVLDSGGGTTDCSMVKVGPSYREQSTRNGSVLGYAGTRVGGTDLDIKLAIRNIMPHLGEGSLLKNGLRIPNSVYWNAVTINDVIAQAKFSSESTGREIQQLLVQAVEKSKVARLQALYKGRYSYRLNRSSELAKIHLSSNEIVNLPLKYIDPDLLIEITRQDLREAINHELEIFISLMKDVENQAQKTPDIIYVTGGTAKSPIVQEYIRSNFEGADIVVGDLFGSVASGLTTWSHRIFC